MNVLQSSDTHSLFGKGLTWHKDCPKAALGHALQQHLSKLKAIWDWEILQPGCPQPAHPRLPRCSSFQMVWGVFSLSEKHTSRLQAPSSCECLFIEHSQAAVPQLIVLPILPQVFSTRPAACPRVLLAVPSIHIPCTHLSLPLWDWNDKSSPCMCSTALCLAHKFWFQPRFGCNNFFNNLVTPELAVGNGGNDTAFHSVQDTNILFSSANSPSQFCLSASTPAWGFHKERKKRVPPEHWNAHSSLSLFAWSVRVLSGALSPLCYLWENSLTGIFIILDFCDSPSQRQRNHCIQMCSPCSMQMEQKNLLFPRTVRSPKWPVWIRGPWHFSKLSLHFGGWKHPKFPVPYSHVLSTLSIIQDSCLHPAFLLASFLSANSFTTSNLPSFFILRPFSFFSNVSELTVVHQQFFIFSFLHLLQQCSGARASPYNLPPVRCDEL